MTTRRKKQIPVDLDPAARLSHFTMERAPDMVFWADSNGRIVRVNQTTCHETGYSEEEFEHMRPYDVNRTYSEKDWPEIWNKIKVTGALTLEVEIGKKNGDSFPAEVKHNYINFEGREYTVSFARDITERKKAEDSLKKAMAEVQVLKNRLEAENLYLQEEIRLDHNFREVVAESREMDEVFDNVDLVSPTDATVLILGETGTGKELIARAIHHAGPRRKRPLIKVDCTNLQAGLVESELFGHEKGAFTGAIKQREGRLGLANRGTLFLDEIGDLPLEQQGKLLRIIQDGEYERLGGDQPIKVDIRFIAATNRDLAADVRNGRFREDLFFRLNVFPIHLPPLRERKDDIPILASHFASRFGKKVGRGITSIAPKVIQSFLSYHWPGNVRELENIMERAVILSQGTEINNVDLPVLITNQTKSDALMDLDEAQQRHILEALKRTGWQVSGEKGAAQILGINPQTLYSRMKKLGIKRPR